MDFLSPILEIGTRLWGCSCKHMAYIHNLEENLQTLRSETDALNHRSRDVWHRLVAAEQQPRMRLKLPSLRLLVPEWPLEKTFGLDSAVERVWRYIEDANVKIIRLCGIGDVGKATLLKKVSNEFHRQSHYFDAVIWTKVAREEDYIEKVQESVRKKLDIPDAVWNQCSGEDEKGAQIFSVLNGKKFVILLDDLWEQFNLLRLGIHLRNDQNQSKLIFTARSLGLYFDMDMEATVTVHVDCLPPEQALSLFKDDCR
ncbi:hypothetical protein PTKIN_Ptkin19aG0082200 [Pterospermum kingtungense]